MANLANIDRLVESGLAPIKKLPYARIVLSDVPTGIKNMVYRELAIRIFSEISNYCINDTIMFNRLRQLLERKHPIRPKAFESLINKAEKSGIPLDVIIEVYERGMADPPPSHLSQEQHAFNRCNSFIAGGMARELDSDLVEWLPASKMEWGSNSLAKEYIKDTPGQSKTLNTIKKVIKKK